MSGAVPVLEADAAASQPSNGSCPSGPQPGSTREAGCLSQPGGQPTLESPVPGAACTHAADAAHVCRCPRRPASPWPPPRPRLSPQLPGSLASSSSWAGGPGLCTQLRHTSRPPLSPTSCGRPPKLPRLASTLRHSRMMGRRRAQLLRIGRASLRLLSRRHRHLRSQLCRQGPESPGSSAGGPLPQALCSQCVHTDTCPTDCSSCSCSLDLGGSSLTRPAAAMHKHAPACAVQTIHAASCTAVRVGRLRRPSHRAFQDFPSCRYSPCSSAQRSAAQPAGLPCP